MECGFSDIFSRHYLFNRSRNNWRDKLRSKFWRGKIFRKPHLKLIRWFSVHGTNNYSLGKECPAQQHSGIIFIDWLRHQMHFVLQSKYIKRAILNSNFNLVLKVSLQTSFVTFKFQMKIQISKEKFSQIFKMPVGHVFQNKAPMTLFGSYSSLTILKFPNLNFVDSSESWYFHLKIQVKTETSNRNFQYHVETSKLQGHAWRILTIKRLA